MTRHEQVDEYVGILRGVAQKLQREGAGLLDGLRYADGRIAPEIWEDAEDLQGMIHAFSVKVEKKAERLEKFSQARDDDEYQPLIGGSI